MLGEYLIHWKNDWWIKLIAYCGVLWFGFIAIALSVFIIRHVSVLFIHSAPYKHYSAVGALLVLFLLSLFSFVNQAREPRIKTVSIKSSKISAKLDGFVIVQLSDLHLDHLKTPRWLLNIVNKTNALNPDLIVITGDLIDSTATEYTQALKLLKAKYGVYAVTGNHDFYAGLSHFTEITNNAGITVLRNERKTINGLIELAGIDDIQGGRFEKNLPSLKEVMQGTDLNKFVILLSHQPQVFEKASALGTDLVLSGHTHAGQIPPMDLIVKFYYKHSCGLYQKGSSFIYTSPGTSFWGPPLRTFSRSEITKIALSRK